MKIRRRSLSLLLALTMIFTFMPALSFAESEPVTKEEARKAIASQAKENRAVQKSKDEKSFSAKEDKAVRANAYDYDYDSDLEATYNGRPTLETVDWVDDDGGLYYYYDILPNSGDSITFKNGANTFNYCWLEDSYGDYYFENPDDPYDWLKVDDIYVSSDNSTVIMSVIRYIWDEEELEYIEDWYVEFYLDKFIINNTVSMITFEPGTIYLVAEDIIAYDEGKPYYSMWKRSKHNKDGSTWTSPYAVGEKMTVTYNNGISQTFTNADILFTYGYNEYYDDYFIKDDYYVWLDVVDDELTIGNNIVKLSWHGVTTTVNVVVETAAQKSAREAAAAYQAALARMMSINTVFVNSSTVNSAVLNNAILAVGGSRDYVTTVVLGSSVKKIAKNTFQGTNVTTVEVKSKKLKAKSVKGSLKGSLVSTVKVSVGSKYKKLYKKIFTKKNAGKKVKVK